MPKIHKVFHNHTTAWVVLAASLVVTALAWYVSNENVKERAEDRFLYRTDDLLHAIRERMINYEQVLWGGVGLFKSSKNVSRNEWFAYVDNSHLAEFYPGIQGMGYSLILKPEELEAHQKQIQAEGFPDYHVKPVGERELYTAIVYLEPFDVRNRRAFGYDMFSQPTRRSAMEYARDTGKSSISSMVTLVQEMDNDIQKGFLMYLPLYKSGMPTDTVEERREAIQGYIYAPFRIGDLMEGVMGNRPKDIYFSIYDGDTITSESEMYESDVSPRPESSHSRTYALELPGNQTWTVKMDSSKSFISADDAKQPLLVATGGIIIDILLFIVIMSLARSERRAEEIAAKITRNLEEVSTRFQLASEAAGLGVWTYEVSDNSLSWDKQMREIYEVEREDFTANYEAWSTSIHPEDRQRAEEELALALKAEKDFDTVFRLRLPSGKVKTIKASAYVQRDAEGAPVRMIGLNTDISSLREAQEGLNIRNRAIEAAPYGVIITDLKDDNKIIYLNPAFTRITGYSPEDALGQNCRFLSKNNRDQASIDILRQAIEKREPCTVVLQNQRKDDSLFWNRLSISPVADAQNNPTHYIGIQEDITREKQQERRLRELINDAKRMAREADSANRAKSEFLANMSHEIRTPMNAILGFTDVLSREINEANQLRHVNAISSSGRMLLQIINDILDLSRIEAGKMLIEVEPSHLPDMLDELQTLFSLKAKEKKLDLNISYPFEQDQLYTLDEVRVRQILFNLLGNAIKFTSSGSVTLDAQEQDGTLPETRTLIFRVSDTGIGIPDDVAEAIFEPFRQQDGQSNRKFGGTGLGLSISRRLAELMDGEISLESKTGEGSTFTLTLPNVPIASASTIRQAIITTDKQVEFSHAKVLIVDDIPQNLDLIEAYLKPHNLQIIRATNGLDAMQQTAKEKPDLIIMDLRMPEMDGSEAIRILREENSTKNIPIIVLTASAHRSEEQELSSLTDGFLTKPIAYDSLIEALKKHLAYTELTGAPSNSPPAQVQSAPPPSADTLNEEAKQALSVHRELLDGELKAQWQRAKTSGLMEDIQDFAKRLKAIAPNTPLESYADTILEATATFNFSEITLLMNDYPRWLESIE